MAQFFATLAAFITGMVLIVAMLTATLSDYEQRNRR